MRAQTPGGQRTGLAILTALLVVFAHGATEAGDCISAKIDEQIRLPDGSLHQAGTLRLCVDRDYSPVASIHTASIDSRSLGFLNSRRNTSEGVAARPFMMFDRDADGSLQLYGYASPENGRMQTYLLQSPPRLQLPLTVAADTVALTALRIPAGAE